MEKHQLAKTIEVVNTALGFLTVNTWSNNAYLCRYAHEVLKFGENVFTLKVGIIGFALILFPSICILVLIAASEYYQILPIFNI